MLRLRLTTGERRPAEDQLDQQTSICHRSWHVAWTGPKQAQACRPTIGAAGAHLPDQPDLHVEAGHLQVTVAAGPNLGLHQAATVLQGRSSTLQVEGEKGMNIEWRSCHG